MRMRGKCLVFILACGLFVILNNLVKLFYFNPFRPQETLPTNSENLQNVRQQRQKLDLFIRKKCRADNLQNCLSDLNTRSWVVVEIPVKEEFSLGDFPEGGKPTEINSHYSPIENSLDSKNLPPVSILGVNGPVMKVDKINPKKVVPKKKPVARYISEKNPHSPEKLKSRLEKLPQDAEVVKFVEEQNSRKAFEKEYCSNKFNNSNGRPLNQNGLQHIIVDKEYRLTFCPVYKAASTSWTVNLLTLKNMWKPSKQRKRVQPLINEVFQRVNNIVAPWISKGTTSFMIVRHPFSRLISCYRDKFEGASKFYYYDRYGEKMVRMFRTRTRPQGVTRDEISRMLKAVKKQLKNGTVSLPGNPYANPVGPTFEEFIKYIVTSKYDDDHWRPFHIQCALCHMGYDFILRFENLSSDSKLFVEYLNQSSVVKTGWENPTEDGTTTKPVVCKFFKKINMTLMTKLIAKYHHDFELFHYKPDEFLKCVSDYKPEPTKLKV